METGVTLFLLDLLVESITLKWGEFTQFLDEDF